jgi:hypothetical protein
LGFEKNSKNTEILQQNFCTSIASTVKSRKVYIE